ncbi:MAG TPA: SigE family RNA polymerase sigma factor [Micromonosporaceae bacterium]|nr:SigE family RNA polymerase sigma factor [Micromonosporaceae bacterium]
MTTTDDSEREFEVFVRSRGHALIRSAYLLTGDQHLAEDLVQSALARTYRVWSRHGIVDGPEAYTRKVMYHLQVSWWRRRRVRENLAATLPDLAGVTDPDVETRLALRAALLLLSDRQRAVIVLRYFDDLTESATAKVLGLTLSAVKTHARRGLERLRELVPDSVDAPERHRDLESNGRHERAQMTDEPRSPGTEALR